MNRINECVEILKEMGCNHVDGECDGGCKQAYALSVALSILEKLNHKDFDEMLKGINEGQCLIIKDGIEQFGKLGQHGRSFIATTLLEGLTEVKDE